MPHTALLKLLGLIGLTACTVNVQINVPTSTGTADQRPPDRCCALTSTLTAQVRVTSPAALETPVGQTTLTPTAPPAVSATANESTSPVIAGCPIFPADDVWNTRVDHLPVDPQSEAYLTALGREVGLHPDFGSGTWEGAPIGIPYVSADSSTPKVGVSFEYTEESDPGPYPIPLDPPIEGGPNSDGDRHILIVDRSACMLYELYAAYPENNGGWRAGSGAVWNLRDSALRPETWTSADAAGLPILPGLVRYDEVAAGEIRHAIRFTAENTRGEFIWPAKHEASDSDDPNLPPFGQRFRLKTAFDISPYPPDVQVILRALQVYGLILADNGSDWYLSGVPDERWNNDDLVPLLRQVTGNNFEAVDESGLMIDSSSGQARPP